MVDRSKVEVVFAEQPGIGHAVRDEWKDHVESEGFPEPVFRSPQDLPPLQAADMVAWFTRRIHTHRSEPVRSRHKPLWRNFMLQQVTDDYVQQLSYNVDYCEQEMNDRFGPPTENYD